MRSVMIRSVCSSVPGGSRISARMVIGTTPFALSALQLSITAISPRRAGSVKGKDMVLLPILFSLLLTPALSIVSSTLLMRVFSPISPYRSSIFFYTIADKNGTTSAMIRTTTMIPAITLFPLLFLKSGISSFLTGCDPFFCILICIIAYNCSHYKTVSSAMQVHGKTACSILQKLYTGFLFE